MRIEIQIVSFCRDFAYLKYCLRSIQKFASGYECVRLVLPWADIPLLVKAQEEWGDFMSKPVYFRGFNEAPPPMGFLHHEIMQCRADEICPDADYVLHIDADQIFTEPVDLSKFYFDNLGKPILVVDRYDHIPECKPWQGATSAALGWVCEFETMRRPGWMHHIGIYQETRKRVEQHTRMPFDKYVLSCKPDFPHGFAEQNTLGAVILHDAFWKTQYHIHDVSVKGWPKSVMIQFAGAFGPPNLPVDIWVHGERKRVVPDELAKEILS